MVTHMCLAARPIKILAAAWLLFASAIGAARADDLDDFHRAVEAAMSHHRVALGYLRTGNVELASLELDGLREGWGKVSALPRPAAFADKEKYTGTILDISAQLIGTTLVLNMGNPDAARQSLDKIRRALSDLRRDGNVTVLADCILDSNAAMTDLAAHDDKTANWNAPLAQDIVGKSAAYRTALERCDGMAPRSIRDHADFRRLIDGAFASLAQMPAAIETRDRDLINRLIRELRSFDNLLAFRYG